MSSNSSGTALVAAVDLGATSGRVVLAEVGPDRLELRETARFANGPLRLPSGLHWNLPSLYAGALGGLRAAGREASGAGGLASVGIDAWAVDYGLVRGDRLLGLPFHYRDEHRLAVGPANAHALVGQDELYARNGLQFLPFNTAYQLAADPWTELADRLLLIPDLLAWWLTGRMVAERTNASTTGLLDPRSGAWDSELLDRLGVPSHLLADLVDPGTTIGSMTDQVAGDTGLPGVPVVAVGSHDTASAVVGAPLQGDDAAYLSLGTWGLVGVELADPVVTDAARAANFTNEGGVDGRTRFLTNVMGTWILSEALRAWDREDGLAAGGNDLAGLLSAAAEVDPASVPVVDVQDPRFLPPGDMGERVAKWCVDHDLPAPTTRPAIIRTILESLADAYAAALDTAARLTGRRVGTVHVVGGGSQNRLLCQAIANRSGRRVVAGPVEATALGNVLVQARAVGVVGPDLAELRALVARTHDLPRYEPRS
ncbi:rhamnulokinase family protein [Intrasporangium sp. YIM S08009]|uniref:rhamnulokinase n=1 Tax=Intrasporangium zincisolvens TaxID=3080018 RepID=UPI002B05EFCC|nr:rhamnulokinase family protein [Intrasporangium sp. YIM S08009]